MKTINLNLLFYGFSQLIGLVIPLFVASFLIKMCGSENFGKAAFVLSIAFILNVIIDFGADVILVKEISEHRNNSEAKNIIFTKAYLGRLPLLALVLILSTVLINFIPFFEKDKYIYLFTLPVFIGQYLNPTWFLQGINEFYFISISNIVNKVLYLLLIMFFITDASSILWVNLFFGLALIFSSLLGLIYIFSSKKVKMTLVSKEDLFQYFHRDFGFLVSQFFLAFKNYSPIIIIGSIGNFYDAGIYRVIEQIINPIRTYMQVFFRFFYPKTCFYFSENYAIGLKYWKKINLFNYVIVFIGLALLYWFDEQILSYFKVTDQNLFHVSFSLKLALLISVFFVFSSSIEQLIFILLPRKFYIRVITIMVSIGTFLSIILFSFKDINGLLVALIIVEFVTFLIYFIFLKKRLNG
jgi:O-antigen/teichoic acid export membrane protein